jgi:hypothetical protein
MSKRTFRISDGAASTVAHITLFNYDAVCALQEAKKVAMLLTQDDDYMISSVEDKKPSAAMQFIADHVEVRS